MKPMLASSLDEAPDSDKWVMEPKYDGWRVIVHRLENEVRLYSRTEKGIWSVPYIARSLEYLPIGTVLDGEIVDLSGDRQWNRAQSILSRKEEHVPRASNPALTFIAFDVIEADGVDLQTQPFRKRREVLEILCSQSSAYMTIAPQWPSSQKVVDELVKAGWEGAVVKHLDGFYESDTRSPFQAKIKPEKAVDALCIGTYPAEAGSKYDGKAVGGICFRYVHEDKEVEGRAAGMDDKLRIELHDHPERFVGRVVEIAHWGIGKDGALRHPNYRRFRDEADKAPAEVTKPTTKVPKVPPTEPKPKTVEAGKLSGRNYAAMGEEKLLRSIKELEQQRGEAYTKCISKGGDVSADLAEAKMRAKSRGLI